MFRVLGLGLKIKANRRTAEYSAGGGSNFEGRNRFALACLIGTGMVNNLILLANHWHLWAILF